MEITNPKAQTLWLIGNMYRVGVSCHSRSQNFTATQPATLQPWSTKFTFEIISSGKLSRLKNMETARLQKQTHLCSSMAVIILQKKAPAPTYIEHWPFSLSIEH